MNNILLTACRFCIDSYAEATITDEGTDAEVLIKKDKNNRTWVVFRGTEDCKDWKFNLQFQDYEFEGVKYHQGFFLVYYALRSRILDIIGTDPVYVSGHSLGGAMAQIMLSDPAPNTAGAITFGAPKVGADLHNTEKLINVQHPLDPVIYTPFRRFYKYQGIINRLPCKLHHWFPHHLENYYRGLLCQSNNQMELEATLSRISSGK